MKIVICASISFTYKIKEVADVLSRDGYEVEIPWSAQRILDGDMSFEHWQSVKEKEGDISFRESSGEDFIKKHYNLIKDSDAILVLNIEKKGVKNYIGGNTFLEMGFAYISDKKIFLLNEIPECSYTDEIKAMRPIVLGGDINKIRDYL